MSKTLPPYGAIEEAMGLQPTSVRPLHGGMVGEVYVADLADGQRVVVKVDRRNEPQLAVEGMMLCYLSEKSNLPVPAVFHSDPTLLIMEFMPGESRFDRATEEHAAELLADLHGIHAPANGFAVDTLIGLLPQPNPWTERWVDFFASQRLMRLGVLAVEMGHMETQILRRVEALCSQLDDFIDEPVAPSLVHGDIWTSNLLASDGRITGVFDPAIYYGHPEVELAYIFLFHSFGEPFLQRYHTLRAIEPGFFETRIHVYQIYPLLSHVCHFGGHYVQSTSDKLAQLGF